MSDFTADDTFIPTAGKYTLYTLVLHFRRPQNIRTEPANNCVPHDGCVDNTIADDNAENMDIRERLQILVTIDRPVEGWQV
jgi:hypothetical protein